MKKYLMLVFCVFFIIISYCSKKSKSKDNNFTASTTSSSKVSSNSRVSCSKNSTKQKDSGSSAFLYFPNSETETSTQPRASVTPARKTSDRPLSKTSAKTTPSISDKSLSPSPDFNEESNFIDTDFDFSDEIDNTNANTIISKPISTSTPSTTNTTSTSTISTKPKTIHVASSSISTSATPSNTNTTSTATSRPISVFSSSTFNSSSASSAKSDIFNVGDKITLFSDDIVDGNMHKLVFKHHYSQNNSEPDTITIKVSNSKYTDDSCETFDGAGTLLGTINGKELYVYIDNDPYNRVYTGIFVGLNDKYHTSKNCIFYGSLNFLKLYSYKFEKNNVDQEVIWESNNAIQNDKN